MQMNEAQVLPRHDFAPRALRLGVSGPDSEQLCQARERGFKADESPGRAIEHERLAFEEQERGGATRGHHVG